MITYGITNRLRQLAAIVGLTILVALTVTLHYWR